MPATPPSLAAMDAMWAFTTRLMERFGPSGTDVLTDDDHKMWQEIAGLCHDAKSYGRAPAAAAPDAALGFSPHQAGFMHGACITAGYMLSSMDRRLRKDLDSGGKELERTHLDLSNELARYAIYSEEQLAALGDQDRPGIYDYEVSEEFGEWFAQYLIDHDQELPNEKEGRAKLVSLAQDFFAQGDALSGATIVLCLTAAREVSAFRVADLAKAADMATEDFMQECANGGSILNAAIHTADPLCRETAPRGSDEVTVFHNLRLRYPSALTVDDLVTQLEQRAGSMTSFAMRCR